MILTAVSRIDVIAQFSTVLIIFIAVLVVAGFSAKWISKYQDAKSMQNNIRIIETSKISPNAFVQILKVGEKYICVAHTKEQVTMLTELKEEEIKFPSMDEQLDVSFQNILAKARMVISKKDDAPKEDDEDEG